MRNAPLMMIAPGSPATGKGAYQCVRVAPAAVHANLTLRFRREALLFTVLAMRHFYNVALVGFMGTGKSTVGNCLASMLHLRFVDTDALIEQRAGKRITEIFASDGEPRFRELESEVVRELESSRGSVISTGGGLVANPANMESLKKHSLVVCLWASPEAILQRVGHQTHRPLLQGADRLEKIKELLAKREPFYRQADVLLNCEQRSPREVAQHVAHQFRLGRRDEASQAS